MAITDTVRKYVEAGREALSPQKAEQLARTLAKQGEIRRDQVAGLARDLVSWSRRNRDRLIELIRAEVRRQISRTGVATKDEVEGLKRRIRELERAARGTTATRAPGRSSAARSSTAKASTAKRTTARPGSRSAGRKKPTAGP